MNPYAVYLFLKLRYYPKRINHLKTLSPTNNLNLRTLIVEQLKRNVRSLTKNLEKVGLLLSGGIDSSILLSILSEVFNGKIYSFCFGFAEDDNEFIKAEKVANIYGSIHYNYLIKDLLEDFDRQIQYMGEPKRNLYHYYVSKIMKKYVDVALSGSAADELFMGYDWRYPIMLGGRNFNSKKKAKLYISTHNRDSVPNNFLGEKMRKFKSDLIIEIFQPIFLNNNNILEATYLADFNFKFWNDLLPVEINMCKMNGLQVRFPFFTGEFPSIAHKIPVSLKYNHERNITKFILRKAFESKLPGDVIWSNEKRGFGPDPLKVWHSGLREKVEERVLDGLAVEQGYLNGKSMSEVIRKSKLTPKLVNAFWSCYALEVYLETIKSG